MGVVANNAPFYALKDGSRQIRFQQTIPRDANLHVAFGETAVYDDRARNEKGFVNFAPRRIIPDLKGSGTLVSENYPFTESLDADLKEANVPRRARGVSLESQNTHFMYVASPGVEGKKEPVALPFPPDPFGAVYPYNSVRETESGHLFEADDTPGRERIKESHRIGTYYEVYPDGTKVTRIVGDDYSVTVRDKAVHVQGACFVTVEGDCNLYTKGNFTQQVDGNYNLWVKGRHNVVVDGDQAAFRLSGAEGKGGDYFEDIVGKKKVDLGGDHQLNIGGNETIVVGSPLTALIGLSGNRSVGVLFSENKVVRMNKTETVGIRAAYNSTFAQHNAVLTSSIVAQVSQTIGSGPAGVPTSFIGLTPASVSTVTSTSQTIAAGYASISGAIVSLRGGLVTIN